MKIEIICGASVGQVALTLPGLEAACHKAEAAVLREWGGYTRTHGCGAWRNANGAIERESCDIWVVYVSDLEPLDIVQAVAEECRKAYHQQSVLLTIDGQHGFITGAKLARPADYE